MKSNPNIFAKLAAPTTKCYVFVKLGQPTILFNPDILVKFSQLRIPKSFLFLYSKSRFERKTLFLGFYEYKRLRMFGLTLP